MATVKVLASILAADVGRLTDEIRRAEAGGVDGFHVDIMDGHFVPNFAFSSEVVRAVKRVTSLEVSSHLMVEHPERHLEAFARAGSDVITVHPETCADIGALARRIRALGVRAGAALNPETEASAILGCLDQFDFVLVMTVHPGFGGQAFLREMLPKIAEVRRRANELGLDLEIGVDGGVNEKTARECVAAGANCLIAGTSIFGAPDLRSAVSVLRGAA